MYHEIENDHENSQPIEHEHEIIWLGDDSQSGLKLNDSYYDLN
jgi:hypothetical protein